MPTQIDVRLARLRRPISKTFFQEWKLIKLFTIIFLFLVFSGCTWVEREYYYASYDNKLDWRHEFFEGKGGGKWVQLPAKEVLIYSHEDLQIKIYSSYLNMTFFGPVIIPIIPFPGDSLKNLDISIEVISSVDSIDLNPQEWRFKVHSLPVSGVTILKPYEVSSYLHEDEHKRKKHMFYRLFFPIEVSDVDEIEIEVEAIKYGKKIIKPSRIKLKKKKGDWYFNGFTV